MVSLSFSLSCYSIFDARHNLNRHISHSLSVTISGAASTLLNDHVPLVEIELDHLSLPPGWAIWWLGLWYWKVPSEKRKETKKKEAPDDVIDGREQKRKGTRNPSGTRGTSTLTSVWTPHSSSTGIISFPLKRKREKKWERIPKKKKETILSFWEKKWGNYFPPGKRKMNDKNYEAK